MDSEAIIGAITGVTKKWTKQRKAEERRASAALNRRVALTSSRYTIKDAAWDVMEGAYLKASASGTLPAHARQIMYAARGDIQDRTGRSLNDQYFTQTLLPDYMRTYRSKTAEWDVVFDARGHLVEPHTDEVVALGTLRVRKYLMAAGDPVIDDAGVELPKISTHGPKHRYGAILFVEKEGFMPLFEKVQLAERYDIAIMSTKGMSNTASRSLVDDLCSKHGLPLLVLHDFDKAGFSIVGTLQRDTRRYEFEHTINVVDLGLRLEDVQAYDLDYEDVMYGGSDFSTKQNLRSNGATADEAHILLDQRVELNAFASGELVEWIESKLAEQGVSKVVPDNDYLERAYRHAIEVEYLKERVKDVLEEAQNHGADFDLPDDLKEKVTERLADDSTLSWDKAVLAIASTDFDDDGGGGT